MFAPTRPINRLLAGLSDKTYRRLVKQLEPVGLSYLEVIYPVGGAIGHVYFPESGIVSLLSDVGNGSTVEVGMVGREGMVGLPVFFGDRSSETRALVQGAGTALRMRAEDFQAEAAKSDELSTAVRSFTGRLMKQVAQSAACSRYHTAEARLGRWLLLMSDGMEADSLRITQELLANMLGVRREAVNKAAGSLQQAGAITYSRGDIAILDRPRLETAACTCYSLISQLITGRALARAKSNSSGHKKAANG